MKSAALNLIEKIPDHSFVFFRVPLRGRSLSLSVPPLYTPTNFIHNFMQLPSVATLFWNSPGSNLFFQKVHTEAAIIVAISCGVLSSSSRKRGTTMPILGLPARQTLEPSMGGTRPQR